MKKLLCFFSLSLFATIQLNAQTTTFDNLNANPYINKAITWTSSNYGSGFGHRIINDDPGGKTLLNFQTRHDTSVWSNLLTLTSDGRVGIGTNNPLTLLDIKSSSNPQFKITHENEAPNWGLKLSQKDNLSGLIEMNGRDLTITSGWNKKIILGVPEYDSNGGQVVIPWGNVAIGTTSPDAKLAVKGNIHTQEVKVDLLGAVAPDYVFYKDYALKTLTEVENYIAEQGHLPNIPSAKEMEAEGIKLKEMNLKLLEKIEELTLYTINQEKRIKHLEQENNTLKTQKERIELLEKQVTLLLKTKE
ncbi:tail fiber protein [Flavivirga sp. 57AJ16]|uniref:tail fiber protein n=1 Tax=Flavivirga sp. 57AJ16 TaxID=3025307 RepID=UPI002365737C|nr:tail fiber protein [Flavivirga sp. 57AJ16]MDD7886021.1 tail fiber protein [Flavivirga sp. 57AJ16]